MAIDINIPSQVKTYADLASFPATGSLKTIFIAEDTNKTYRWTGSVYVEVSAAPPSGITIGTTAITSGTVGRVLFEGTGNVVQESANLFWDNTNVRLGVGTSSPAHPIDARGLNEIIKITATGGGATIKYQNSFGSTWNAGSTGNDFYWLYNGVSSFMTLKNNGNLLINTTTDAGYKLDVNGTARINTLNIGLGGGQIALNTAIGVNALNANTTGTANTVYGNASGRLNIDGSNNTFIGRASGEGNTSGGNNTFLGAVSGTANSSGGNNVFIGRETGSVNTTGSTNTSIGTRAGNANTTGSNNIFIGYLSTGVSATESNRTWIGNSSTTTTWLAGNVLIGTTTDAGYKLDVNGTSRFVSSFRCEGQATFISAIIATAQVRIGTNPVAASAVLDVQSTTQGFLPPRMTTTQKNAIASPASGLMVYDTTLNVITYYNGTTWI